MSSLFKRGSKLHAKVKAVDGKWKPFATRLNVGEEAQARKLIAKKEREVEAQRAAGQKADDGPVTVERFARVWLDERRKLDLDWKLDRGRLDHHVLPMIGDMLVTEVRTRHIIELVTRIRTTPSAETGQPLAPRSVYNIYSVVLALFRDAKLAGLIEQTPCCLTERQLGPKRDKNPEWRAGAVFTRDEAQTLISTPLIPLDRRTTYGIELLAGLRPGESAALRWRNYDPRAEPLGKLLVATAYSTKRNVTKGTKTETVKHVPVHPTLAAMLAEWFDSGWPAMMGRPPGPDDLIVPIPPADAAQRTSRRGDEPFRTCYDSARRWTEDDLAALKWRHRRHYDMRATFITLALEDGADPFVIETRVTHTKRSRSAFDGYNRGRQWEITCTQVAKLKLMRDPHDLIALAADEGSPQNTEACAMEFGAVLVQPENPAAMSASSESGRRDSNRAKASQSDHESRGLAVVFVG
jgi:integrase